MDIDVFLWRHTWHFPLINKLLKEEETDDLPSPMKDDLPSPVKDDLPSPMKDDPPSPPKTEQPLVIDFNLEIARMLMKSEIKSLFLFFLSNKEQIEIHSYKSEDFL